MDRTRSEFYLFFIHLDYQSQANVGLHLYVTTLVKRNVEYN